MTFAAVPLEGHHVRLEPLALHHRDGLAEAVADGELWNLVVTIVPRPEHVETFIKQAMGVYELGEGLAFATIHRETNKVIGSTRFMKASLPNKRVEIGHTFLAKSHQRSRANTEAKLLMLTHAFEALGLNRVEFLTDYLNSTSRSAILRLGAKEEGVLRKHMVMPNGRIRDSVIFSIIANEWTGVKQGLQAKLG